MPERDVKRELKGQEIKTGMARLDWLNFREYYETRPGLLFFVVAATIAASFVGLVLDGWRGGVVGLIISAGASFLGLRAITKVRDTKQAGLETDALN
jgi:hypothetical protein